MEDGLLWMILTVGGVVLLGVAIAYSIMRNRKVTPSEDAAGERGAKRVYAEEQRDPAN